MIAITASAILKPLLAMRLLNLARMIKPLDSGPRQAQVPNVGVTERRCNTQGLRQRSLARFGRHGSWAASRP